MGGKAALVFIAGFILIFSFYQQKLSRMTVSAAENYNVNYMKSLVHESAVTAMNFAVNKIWNTGVAFDSFTVYNQTCTTVVRIDTLTGDTIRARAKSRGWVFTEDSYAQFGTPMLIEDSIYAFFGNSVPVCRYFWLNNSETGINWITGDTAYGPLHTNGIFRTNGSPVFYGKVTALKGIAPNPTKGGNKAKFYGGWEVGIDAPLPTNMTPIIITAIAANGFAPLNTKCLYNKDVTFEFLANGDVIRTLNGSGVTDTVAVTSIAPAGVIYSTTDVFVKGVFNGQLTILANDILIEDDLVYAVDPRTDPNSDDLLGLIGLNDVIITENAANNSDCNLQAACFAVYGSFGAENAQTRPISGTLEITGSIIQNKEGQIGTWSSSVTHGYRKKYYFDERLYHIAPPKFPTIQSLMLLAWWE